MNPYDNAFRRISELNRNDIDVLRELKDTRGARDEARQNKEAESMTKLPYTSRPEFLGEIWK